MLIFKTNKRYLLTLLKNGVPEELDAIKTLDGKELLISVDDGGDWGECVAVSPLTQTAIKELAKQDIFNGVDFGRFDGLPKGSSQNGVFIDSSLEICFSGLLPFEIIGKLKGLEKEF